LAHAWGTVFCGRPWCLSWEMKAWKESFEGGKWEMIEKVIGIPFQLLNRFRFCRACKEKLTKAGAYST